MPAGNCGNVAKPLNTDDPEGMTLEEVGRAFGMGKQVINKIERRAIRKLWRRQVEIRRKKA